MNEQEIMILLQLVTSTLQTDYNSKDKCKEAINHLLKEIDKAAIKVSGKSIVKQKTLLDAIVNPTFDTR